MKITKISPLSFKQLKSMLREAVGNICDEREII